ncbi:hypothetical protein B0T26DRAFT_676095 [Lasiosphaeria miniovina]|uniref:Uncharacterized protein n=1 Tax=Lasiosphaeria miniovina TaxID=1954250 RepID=A0AA40DYP8_9PEZI|nr:uncharacterized protein B0T26DRAFT_676095 [Lasiosphaeria miniovina]KAK0717846.1 hypothetical protein B0T26DRAFT_676095 [Lasiosphaeria miniovina]
MPQITDAQRLAGLIESQRIRFLDQPARLRPGHVPQPRAARRDSKPRRDERRRRLNAVIYFKQDDLVKRLQVLVALQKTLLCLPDESVYQAVSQGLAGVEGQVRAESTAVAAGGGPGPDPGALNPIQLWDTLLVIGQQAERLAESVLSG